MRVAQRRPLLVGASLLLASAAAYVVISGGSEPPITPVERVSSGAVPGARAERVRFRGHTYDVFHVDLERLDVELFWMDSAGRRIASRRLREHLRSRGRRLVFATNAGMFSPEYAPVGLHVANGRELAPLNLRDSAGNFYLEPNGVFVVSEGAAAVVESHAYRVPASRVEAATQSGPLLVHGGRLHPRFQAGSGNLAIRSGVGVPNPRTAVFAISREEVSFHDFASLFRERLECREALFLDGAISRMYLPELGREDLDGDFTGILAVSVPAGPEGF